MGEVVHALPVAPPQALKQGAPLVVGRKQQHECPPTLLPRGLPGGQRRVGRPLGQKAQPGPAEMIEQAQVQFGRPAFGRAGQPDRVVQVPVFTFLVDVDEPRGAWPCRRRRAAGRPEAAVFALELLLHLVQVQQQQRVLVAQGGELSAQGGELGRRTVLLRRRGGVVGGAQRGFHRSGGSGGSCSSGHALRRAGHPAAPRSQGR